MLWTLLLTTFIPLPCLASIGKTVDLGYVKYHGAMTHSNTVAYLGIPYAEPPTGDRRFRAPLPLDTARVGSQAGGAIMDATTYPQFCIQGTTGKGDAGGAGSEDCLKVNIYAPLDAEPGNKLPVLVYIHGGGYVYGNPANWPFDHWVHQVPNVVIVSVYYRLDALGFLSNPAFATSSDLGDLNVGFLDQGEALHWVQEHISAFGGDPARVTISGQSAGASSVELHLVSGQSGGLFHQAIAQSVYRTPIPTPEQQEPLFDFFADKAGCGSGRVDDKMQCLRSASVSAISQAQDAQFNGSYNAFHPVLDGKVITSRPTISFLSGNFHPVDVLVGATSNETLPGDPDYKASLRTFFPLLSNEDLSEFGQQYPASDFGSTTEQARAFLGESQLRCAAEVMGWACSRKVKAFVYRYNTPSPTMDTLAVEHSAENWMMFRGSNTGFNGGGGFTPMTPSEGAFAEELIAYWLSFVRTGDPNTYKLDRAPTWPTYSANSAQRIVLTEGTTTQTGSTVEAVSSAETRRCAFVAGKANVQQN